METEITVKNLQKKIPLNLRQITQAVKKILHHQGLNRAELSLAFVGDRTIKSLNQKYLKRSYPTDVLAFDLSNNSSGKKLVGEIIISTDTVFRNSGIFGTTPRKEFMLCLIHGLLHLLGFDDRGLRETARMRRKEKELLKLCGYDS